MSIPLDAIAAVVHPLVRGYVSGRKRLAAFFPELRPFLETAFQEAPEGAEFVIGRYRDGNKDFRTRLERIIRRAGLEPWPKLFQNLRSTRQTELQETFPSHVVCKWIGNGPKVASKHYLQVTEVHYEKAAQNPAQYVQVRPGKGQERPTGNAGIYRGLPHSTAKLVAEKGLEHKAPRQEKTGFAAEGGANSGAPGGPDADREAWLDAWLDACPVALSGETKTGILAMVRTSCSN